MSKSNTEHDIKRYLEPYQSCEDCEVEQRASGYDVKMCEQHHGVEN